MQPKRIRRGDDDDDDDDDDDNDEKFSPLRSNLITTPKQRILDAKTTRLLTT